KGGEQGVGGLALRGPARGGARPAHLRSTIERPWGAAQAAKAGTPTPTPRNHSCTRGPRASAVPGRWVLFPGGLLPQPLAGPGVPEIFFIFCILSTGGDSFHESPAGNEEKNCPRGCVRRDG